MMRASGFHQLGAQFGPHRDWEGNIFLLLRSWLGSWAGSFVGLIVLIGVVSACGGSGSGSESGSGGGAAGGGDLAQTGGRAGTTSVGGQDSGASGSAMGGHATGSTGAVSAMGGAARTGGGAGMAAGATGSGGISGSAGTGGGESSAGVGGAGTGGTPTGGAGTGGAPTGGASTAGDGSGGASTGGAPTGGAGSGGFGTGGAGAGGTGTGGSDSGGSGGSAGADACPQDPNKTQPGDCGCGVSDIDSDADGTPDCDDGCPADPTKASPGGCGCGVADSDSDGDDTLDCDDLCPDNPAIQRPGTISVSVQFDEEAAPYSDYFADIESCILFAGAEYARHLIVMHDVSIEVLAQVIEIPTASGASATSVLDRVEGSFNIYHQGVAAEIISGVDPNGEAEDARIAFGITPLTGTGSWSSWFDPDPETRTAPIPDNSSDAMSTCLHEFGHILMFNGWRDSTNWEPSPGIASTYDTLSIVQDNNPFFDGPIAHATYEGPLAQTFDSPSHLGNLDPRPGTDLDTVVMHGTPSKLRFRYVLDDIVLSVLADGGLPVVGTPAAEGLCDTARLALAPMSLPPILGPPPLPVE